MYSYAVWFNYGSGVTSPNRKWAVYRWFSISSISDFAKCYRESVFTCCKDVWKYKLTCSVMHVKRWEKGLSLAVYHVIHGMFRKGLTRAYNSLEVIVNAGDNSPGSTFNASLKQGVKENSVFKWNINHFQVKQTKKGITTFTDIHQNWSLGGKDGVLTGVVFLICGLD